MTAVQVSEDAVLVSQGSELGLGRRGFLLLGRGRRVGPLLDDQSVGKWQAWKTKKWTASKLGRFLDHGEARDGPNEDDGVTLRRFEPRHEPDHLRHHEPLRIRRLDEDSNFLCHSIVSSSSVSDHFS